MPRSKHKPSPQKCPMEPPNIDSMINLKPEARNPETSLKQGSIFGTFCEGRGSPKSKAIRAAVGSLKHERSLTQAKLRKHCRQCQGRVRKLHEVLKRQAPKTMSSEASDFKAKTMSSESFRRSSEDNVVSSFRRSSEDNVFRRFRRSSEDNVFRSFRRSSEDNVVRSFGRSSEDTVFRKLQAKL